MKAQNGISLVALIVTIIVVIILASISLNVNYDSFTMLDKTKYVSQIRGLEERLRIYHEDATLDADLYVKDNLSWDGVSERAENTGKLEDGVNEDTPKFIFKEIPSYFKEKICIKKGELVISQYTDEELEWLQELQIKNK